MDGTFLASERCHAHRPFFSPIIGRGLIGPYTASALMAAVFGLHEPLIDVNMARVLSRFFGTGDCDASARDATLHTLAFHLVRGERCLSANWAVLDLGALVCRARNPLCQECPLREECRFLSKPSGA